MPGTTEASTQALPQTSRLSPVASNIQTFPKLVGQNTATTSPGALWVMSIALVRPGDRTQDDLQPFIRQDSDS